MSQQLSRSAAPERGGPPIVIVGAGVIGASIAHRLARGGHDMLVLDGADPGSAATSASFAWVGLSNSDASAFKDPLRARARAAFDRVLNELAATPAGSGASSLADGLEFRANGALSWEDSEALTREFVSGHRAAGHPVNLVTREEALSIEPALRNAPAVSAHSPGDAGIDPVALTRALLASAEHCGAELRSGILVSRIVTEHGRAVGVETADGIIPASHVILAAGTGSPALAASAGAGAEVTLTPGPCALLRFAVEAPIVRGILATPELEIRQLDDATLIAAEDVPGGFTGDPAELAGPVLAAIAANLSETRGIRLVSAVIADRPMPASGVNLVGESTETPGLHLAIAHPGVILSAAIAERVAEGIAAPSRA